MLKKVVFFYLLLEILPIGHLAAYSAIAHPESIQQWITNHSNTNDIGTPIRVSLIPQPYQHLLSQPLMTKGIEEHYQRTPIIQVLYAKKNQSQNTYFRAILMRIDSDKIRNNPEFAQKNNKTKAVEFAMITMNFNALPKGVIDHVLNTSIPFGQSLRINHIKTMSTDRHYFSIPCDETLSSIAHCASNQTLYGRTNTLIRTDTHQWVAHVMEILL